MKLYYSPAACSLAPHIALHESGLKFTAELVSLPTKKTNSNADFTKINPKGYVPVLELDNGEILTEGAVIMQYIADQKPDSGLMPKAGMERYRAMEMLNFIASEIHKGFSPLWNDKMPAEAKAMFTTTLGKRMDVLSESLKNRQFLMGDRFTCCDGYLFTVLSWAPHVKFDLTKWPTLMGYVERVRMRPAVQAALRAEGLLK